MQLEPQVMRLDDPVAIRGANSREIWRDRHRHERIHLELQTLTPAENGYRPGRLDGWSGVGFALLALGVGSATGKLVGIIW